jgi:hypothetical protein
MLTNCNNAAAAGILIGITLSILALTISSTIQTYLEKRKIKRRHLLRDKVLEAIESELKSHNVRQFITSSTVIYSQVEIDIANRIVKIIE